MSKRSLRLLAAVALCALMTTGSAWAQGRRQGAAANQGWRADRDGGRDISRDWRGDRDRWTFGNNERPRGWDQGKKTGWGDCDVPPGQAKKMGCSPSSRVFGTHHVHHSRRDRDRDRDRNRDWNRDRDRRSRR